MRKKVLPSFFIIGAAKSGTTSLHKYINQHPDIYMSPVKEPNFFSFMEQKPDYSGPQISTPNRLVRHRLDRAKYDYSITTWDKYHRLFKKVRNEKTIGESSVSYLYFPAAAKQIKKWIPNAKIIAILRNPADRAHSKFLQFRRDGCEPMDDFSKALEAEEERIHSNWSPTWFYKARGFYCRQLKPFYDSFDHSQIKIILYDDFLANVNSILRELFQFLEVDDSFAVDTTLQHNVSRYRRVPYSVFIYSILNKPNWLSNTIKRLFSQKFLDRIQPILITGITKQMEKLDEEKMSSHIRKKLILEFRNDIECLEALINRDLSAWLNS